MSLFRSQEAALEVDDKNVVASLRRVSKSYAGAIAVKDVSLEISRGTLAILTGHSGSGKSTLLAMLEGVVTPDTGEVVLFGNSLTGMNDAQLKRIKQYGIGIGFQSANLDRGQTVADVIKQTANANNVRVDNRRVVELAARFNMLTQLGAQAGSLSGGQQMRVSLMRALATRPELILLDEPIGAIEAKGKAEALGFLREIVDEEQATVVMITHDPDIAREYVDIEYVLEGGELVDTLVHV